MVRWIASGWLSIVLAAFASPQDALQPAPEERPELRFVVQDGSTILGRLDLTELRVTTKYGIQIVPVSEVRSFTPGLASKPDLLRRIETHIENLASEAAEARDLAEKALMEMGSPIRGELKRYAKDKDVERRTRVDRMLLALEEIEQERSEEESADASAVWIREDRLETTGFAMIGDIQPKELTVKTRYGDMKVALADIGVAKSVAVSVEPVVKVLTVSQAEIAQKNWKSAGIKLERGMNVSVSAEGSITMTPWGGSKTSGPEGSAEYGWFDPNGKIEAGSLVARIGKRGEVFKLGDRRTFTADSSGILYVAIAMNPSYLNYQFPGEYKLRVHVK